MRWLTTPCRGKGWIGTTPCTGWGSWLRGGGCGRETGLRTTGREKEKQQQWFDISRVKQTFVVSLYELMAVIYILKCPPGGLVYLLWRFLFLAFSPNYPLDGTVDLALQPSKPPGGILPSEPGKKKSDKTHLVQGRFYYLDEAELAWALWEWTIFIYIFFRRSTQALCTCVSTDKSWWATESSHVHCTSLHTWLSACEQQPG